MLNVAAPIAWLRRHPDALLVLHEAGRRLGAGLEPEEIGAILLDLAGRIAPFEAAQIRLRDAAGRLRAWQTVGPEALWRAVRRASAAQLARRAAVRTGTSQFFRIDGRPSGDEDPLAGRCGWCLPLRVQDRVIGVLEAYGPWPAAAGCEILVSLAGQAANALESARLHRALSERERRLQELLGQVLLAQEEERRRVAYDIHDGLAQVAAATHQHLQTFASHYRPRSIQALHELERAQMLARRTVGEARRVIAGLRPTALDDFGLEAAIRLEVEAFRAEGWQISYDAGLGVERLPPLIETVLYRVAQEALTNVRKHAQTNRVHLALQRRPRSVSLEVRDWGLGFVPAEAQRGAEPGQRVGLPGMRERIALLGGRWTVRSRPGHGTRVLVEVPIPSSSEPVGAAGTHDGR